MYMYKSINVTKHKIKHAISMSLIDILYFYFSFIVYCLSGVIYISCQFFY